MAMSKRRLFVLILGILVVLGGFGWLFFLFHVYPTLVPPHGGGEPFEVHDGNYTLPWDPVSMCKIWVITEESVTVYLDGEFVGYGKEVTMNLTPGPHNVTVSSSETVAGRMVARQEIPIERLGMASIIIVVGIVIISFSLIPKRKSTKTPQIAS